MNSISRFVPAYPSDGVIQPGPLVGQELFSFKALVQGEQLVVRGYLRRDYRHHREAGDRAIACIFGEFRFDGCRKIVTAAHRGQIVTRELVLAPVGTKFDRMWFTQTGSPLVVFDGTFPSNRVLGPHGGLGGNKPGSIASDPTSTLAHKLDIPVLGKAPTPFRVLAPHQDLQFVCDRPFFYVDRERAFMVTSTGSTTSTGGIKGADWTVGNVGTMFRAGFFPVVPPPPEPPPLTPLTLLVVNDRGQRIEKRLPPVDLQPFVAPKTLLPTFATTRRYQFTTFSHPFVCRFVQILDRDGVPGLLSLETQSLATPQSFAAYEPLDRVDEPHPADEVDFASGGAFDVYNWELFFHVPLLVAERLRANQRFADARKWFHYIFDPTGSSPGDIPQRYWRMKPFHDRLAADYEAESVKAIEEMVARGPSDALLAAVAMWRDNPFSPHAIARLRTTAYQKAVVMKYIDNLLAYGDQLFSRDTLETINEATQLYVLAAELLGRQPEIIDRDIGPPVATFNSLELTSGGLGNALEQLELLAATNAPTTADPTQPAQPVDVPVSTALLFCVPENAKLLGYWSTVADRLFKIRHCMNIAGQVRQLPLFEPPIDPALLVRARAAGLDISEVISNVRPSLPSYRFSTMLARANELAAEVKSLGTALLSVLEKRDAEALSTLRSRHEVRMLQSIRDLRKSQVDEARANIAALRQSRNVTDARKTFYETRERINASEASALRDLLESQALALTSGAYRSLAAVLKTIGVFKFGFSDTGPENGAAYMGSAYEAAAAVTDTAASFLASSSHITSRQAEFGRRADDWALQARLATIELKQIDQQLIASEIRLAIAERELANHDQQIDQAREVEQFLRSKFTNQDLYQFMIGQVSGLYFQTYQLASELAKRAEICMQHELGLELGSTGFIRFGHWDTLHKGLWAGEHLAHDLKRLEIAYLEGNARELELTKHISLEALAPAQLLELRTTGSCELEIPEWVFDLDTPGHFLRRIKAVSLTMPCVTGPFTTVHCKLQLLAGSYRHKTDLADGYARKPPDEVDSRFIDDRKINESIVTSTGQNDPGLFEANLRDERYLPFEGAGAISKWRLELPTDFRTFDYATISDVVLHLRYTARDGGPEMRTASTAAVAELLGSDNSPLFRLVSVRHDFPVEWQELATFPTTATTRTVTIDLSASRFPFFAQSRPITIYSATAQLAPASDHHVAIRPGRNAPAAEAPPFEGAASPGPWTIATDADPRTLDDIFVTLAYSVQQ